MNKINELQQWLEDNHYHEGVDYIIVKGRIYLFLRDGNLNKVIKHLAEKASNTYVTLASSHVFLTRDALCFEYPSIILP
jgi:hypothetical protein